MYYNADKTDKENEIVYKDSSGKMLIKQTDRHMWTKKYTRILSHEKKGKVLTLDCHFSLTDKESTV